MANLLKKCPWLFTIVCSLLMMSNVFAQTVQTTALHPILKEVFINLSPLNGGNEVYQIFVPVGAEDLSVYVAFEEDVDVNGSVLVPDTITNEDDGSISNEYVLVNPQPGTWEVQFSTLLAEKQFALLEIMMTGEQIVRSGIMVDFFQKESEPTALSVAVFAGNQAVTGANVELTLTDQITGLKTIENLFDDGTTVHGDADQGDGLYSGLFNLDAGVYTVFAQVTGSMNNVAFEHSATVQFEVRGEFALLEGSFSDESLDTNSDGLADKVVLTFPLQAVNREGEYSVRALVTASNGAQIYSCCSHTELFTSSTEIVAELKIDEIKEQLAVNGPFEVKEVVFMWDPLSSTTSPGSFILQTLTNLGQTQAYSLKDFQRPYITFVEFLGDEGIDTNNNGQFDFIEVEFTVDSVLPFDFQFLWNAILVPEDGLPEGGRAALDVNQGTLSFGENILTLSFPVEEYGVNKIAGTFIVDELTLYAASRLPSPYNQVGGKDFKDLPESFGPTNDYSVFELEGGLPGDIPSLIAYLQEMTITAPGNASEALRKGLINKLEKTQQELDAGRIKQAENQLNAFSNKIDAHAGKEISSEDTDIIQQSVVVIKSNF